MNVLSVELSSLAKTCCHYPLGLILKKQNMIYHESYFYNPRPILLVHGIIHNRSAFIPLKSYLTNQGFMNVSTMNYRTSHGNITKMVQALAAKVNQVLEFTGAQQVDIIAHSLGGIVARSYMSQNQGWGKVKQLITIGTAHHGVPMSVFLRFFQLGSLYKDLYRKSCFLKKLNTQALPKGSKITSIYSPQDKVAWPTSSCILNNTLVGEVSNYEVNCAGHLSLLYNEHIFKYIYNNLRTSPKS